MARGATDVEGLANLLISLLAVVDNAEPFIDQLVATITSLEAPKASALKVYGPATAAGTLCDAGSSGLTHAAVRAVARRAWRSPPTG